MHCRVLIVAAIASIAGVTGPVASQGISAPGVEGLAVVRSGNCDEFYLRPGANLSAYRKVMIDPARVLFHKDWLRHGSRGLRIPVGEDDAKRIAEEIAADAHVSIADAFRAGGLELVASPGQGVLWLSPSVADLYVNAPDRYASARILSLTRGAGQAVLGLDARDSVSGAMVGRVVHRGTAQDTRRFAVASDASNRSGFEALVRHWAATCATEFTPGRH